MTMPTTDFAVPRGSFPTPVKPPGVAPLQPPLVELRFNFAWCQVITGALSQLLLQSTWDVQTQAELTAIQQDVFDLMSTMCANPPPAGFVPNAGTEGGEFLMIRQDPDNPCLLQSSIDGITWCTWADLTKCAGTPNQTGNGSPQPAPGGGTQCYSTSLAANDRYWIPTPLSAGDVVDVSFSGGVWADPLSPLPRCPDGTIFMGLGCVTGTEFTNSTDPMPSKPHASIVINIDGTFYAQVDGLITVPSGVSNAMAFVQGNFETLNAASGSAQIKVCVTNNKVATWSHTFDFTLSKEGWDNNAPLTAFGSWSPGVGWVGAETTAPGPDGTDHYWGVNIHIAFPSRVVTSVVLPYSYTIGEHRITDLFANDLSDQSGALDTQNQPATGDGNLTFHFSGSVAMTALEALVVTAIDPAATPSPTGSVLIASITVNGEGTDPFV